MTDSYNSLVENLQSLAGESGSAFFARMAEMLTSKLAVDCCLVSEILPDNSQRARVLASHTSQQQPSGRAADSGVDEFSLVGMPGVGITEPGSSQWLDDVAAHANSNAFFSEYIARFKIKSYLLMPVFGQRSQLLGHIILMHSQPMAAVDDISSLLAILAIGASAEIERSRHSPDVEKLLKQRKMFIDDSSRGMFVIDIVPPMPTTLSIQQQVKWLAENTRFVESNQATNDILGQPDIGGVVGMPLYHKRIKYDFASMARDFVSQQYTFREYLIPVINCDKKTWLSLDVRSDFGQGQLSQLYGVVSNVTSQIVKSRRMEYRAKHDSLTGLANRGYFIEQAEAVLSLSPAQHKHALFMLDLDGFKEVNDTLGHETGDKLLKEIGPRLAKVLTKVDGIHARLGGDEFAVFIENYHSEDDICALAGEIMVAIKAPYTINGLELSVGGSVGIATYPDSSDSLSSLMRCADIAMYQAKRQSRDYCLYSSESDHYTVRRLSLMMDIRQAISNDELRLYYQPIMELENQQVIGFEALIRWEHPELGMLPPAEFIPLIELTDMIAPVTSWVIETAVQQLASWRQLGWEYRVSVNVSTRNLVDVRFVSFIEDCLARHQVEGRYLEIEITESTLMADPDKARQVLLAIAELGVLVSIDDYGTGYSSLAYLKSLPIDTLKIDRTFISQMLLDSQDKIIVQSTIQLAHNLGLQVTAEGIEDVSLIADLKALGCDKGQGYYFCRPIPVEELKPWLTLNNRREQGSC
jgi:diguanylate cyclase (GGDEF)-like protein